MAEYIERESLKKVLTRYLNAPHVQMGYSVGQGMRIAIKSCIELLDNEYAADVAPVKHGYNVYEKGSSRFECSECGYEDWDTMTCEPEHHNFCPHCGAKMDKEDNDG